MKCCLCGKEFSGYGNNPSPCEKKFDSDRCCDECNIKYVIPERIKLLNKQK